MLMERRDWSTPAASLSPITPVLLLFGLNGCASLAHLRFPPVNPRLVTANKLARRVSKPEGCWTGQGSRTACMAIMPHPLPGCSPRLWPSWRARIGSFVRGTVRQKGINVGDNSSQTSRPTKLCDGERGQITPFCSLNYKLRSPPHDVAVKACNSSVAGEKVHFHVKIVLLVKDILSILWPNYRPSTEWLQRKQLFVDKVMMEAFFC
jgi:hypothetical protein